MAFAQWLLANQKRAYRWALRVGLACLALFLLLRILGGFGNLRMPTGTTLIDFFNVVKYPPSLSFLLLSLGFDLILLNLFSHAARLCRRLPGHWSRWDRPPYTSSCPTGSSTLSWAGHSSRRLEGCRRLTWSGSSGWGPCTRSAGPMRPSSTPCRWPRSGG